MKYYIQIFIEKAGTKYQKKNEGETEITHSMAGHMWFRIYQTDEYGQEIKNSIKDAGYTPNGIVNTDDENYLGESACQSSPLSITKQQYHTLAKFAQNIKNSLTSWCIKRGNKEAVTLPLFFARNRN